MQAAHQFLTFCAATPLQVAMASALREADAAFFDLFRSAYAERRALLLQMLESAGFTAAPPAGTYFALASFERLWSAMIAPWPTAWPNSTVWRPSRPAPSITSIRRKAGACCGSPFASALRRSERRPTGWAA